MRILAVCTANRCRSPMLAGLLGARLAEHGMAAEVVSAGFGPAEEPALPDAVVAMAEAGIDLSGHRSQTVTPELCEQADLVIGMTRQHIIDLVLMAPPAWPRTFPIVDLVQRAERAGGPQPGEDVGAWVRRVHGGRQRGAIMAIRSPDEIADPVGLPFAAFKRTRDQLDGLAQRLATLLATAGPDQGGQNSSVEVQPS